MLSPCRKMAKTGYLSVLLTAGKSKGWGIDVLRALTPNGATRAVTRIPHSLILKVVGTLPKSRRC